MMRLQAIPTMLSMIPSVFAGVGLQDLEKIKAITRKAYPSVPQLDTVTLANWMQDTAPTLLLIDVRSPAEFAISHLHGAINLQTPGQIAEHMTARKPVKTVLYCAVGFRSSRLADVLGQNGPRGVMNLEGSIFQWANEGRAVYRGTVPVQQVHPYSRRWSGLLKPSLASDV
jgi:rhodanese-related sulfurtransferase